MSVVHINLPAYFLAGSYVFLFRSFTKKVALSFALSFHWPDMCIMYMYMLLTEEVAISSYNVFQWLDT